MTGWQETQITTNRYSEFHITITPLPGESPTATFGRLVKWVKENNAIIVRNEILGGLFYHDAIYEYLEKAVGTLDWHIVWTQGSQDINKNLRGINVMAVKDTPVSISSMAISCRAVVQRWLCKTFIAW
jgi:hypothetical protein